MDKVLVVLGWWWGKKQMGQRSGVAVNVGHEQRSNDRY